MYDCNSDIQLQWPKLSENFLNRVHLKSAAGIVITIVDFINQCVYMKFNRHNKKYTRKHVHNYSQSANSWFNNQ